jgi:hypothetical protein
MTYKDPIAPSAICEKNIKNIAILYKIKHKYAIKLRGRVSWSVSDKGIDNRARQLSTPKAR